MLRPSVNRDSYNLIAANYAREHGDGLAWKAELDKFIDCLVSPDIVLDLGCGHGDETVYLAKNLPGTEVIGIDFAEQMISLAQKKDSDAEFVVSDLVSYDPKRKVQGIWARASLHHLTNQQLHALFERLDSYADRPLVLAMVNKLGDGEEIEEKQKYDTRLRRYFNYFSPAKVDRLAAEFGYHILEQYVKPEGEHQFLVSYLKSGESSA